jgi:hypothetical protein
LDPVPVDQYTKLRNVEESVMNLFPIAVNRYEILSNLKETTDSNIGEMDKLQYKVEINYPHVVPTSSISIIPYNLSTKGSKKKKCKGNKIVFGERIQQTLHTNPVTGNEFNFQRLITKKCRRS